ncbi:WYL domain-containing protein [Phototrophicus methaneseepsis]|uniref:WYL domain-containing protein n=1 Tax=Phototrophicus methaneseepsis TaxID=2710758 RepID=A0A7S8EAT3_9CHLR|nr:WYL domain-containing protein [Phototrophicus methaneseepsis]QPC83434.1 WYL domain-containing protein [Phototrophicus methaneseepsis]
MRADRLLSLLLLLQGSHQTARDLASALEVSERTIYRDVEALSMAGIPIYTQPGTNGGVFLDEDYRLTLTGLTREQVLSLFATSDADPLAELGLGHAAKHSLMKLFNMLPVGHQHEVNRMRQRFLFDAAGWFHTEDLSAHLHQLQAAVWGDHQIELQYQPVGHDIVNIRLDAIALVSKSDKWYLVGRRQDGEYRTYKLTRIHGLTVLNTHFERDEAFDLADYWAKTFQQFQQYMNQANQPCTARLRIHPKMLWYLEHVLDGHFEQVAPFHEAEWLCVDLQFSAQDEALSHILAMGTQAEIIAPAAMRAALRSLARSILDFYDGSS